MHCMAHIYTELVAGLRAIVHSTCDRTMHHIRVHAYTYAHTGGKGNEYSEFRAAWAQLIALPCVEPCIIQLIANDLHM